MVSLAPARPAPGLFLRFRNDPVGQNGNCFGRLATGFFNKDREALIGQPDNPALQRNLITIGHREFDSRFLDVSGTEKAFIRQVLNHAEDRDFRMLRH